MAQRDKFIIDGHKLNWHRDRVQQWLAAERAGDWNLASKVYPIYVEVSPVGACNHRCTFCAVDYIGYKDIRLSADALRKVLDEMARGGVKSVMWAGEGEPLLHKDLGDVIVHAKSVGIDSSITTNAAALTEKFCRKALRDVTWIKASVNGGTAATYAKVHRTSEKDFDRVFRNLEQAVKLRAELGAATTLGIQTLLLPEIWDEVPGLARRARDIGLDYLVVKPYSQHNFSITKEYQDLRYKEIERLEKLDEQLAAERTDTFDIIFRKSAMKEYARDDHSYSTCQATPSFWAYLMADGSLYGCSAYLLDPRFCYGNVLESSFNEVWEGEKRRLNWDYVRNELDINECRKNCRMHQVNLFLDKVRKADDVGAAPQGSLPAHVNFI